MSERMLNKEAYVISLEWSRLWDKLDGYNAELSSGQLTPFLYRLYTERKNAVMARLSEIEKQYKALSIIYTEVVKTA